MKKEVSQPWARAGSRCKSTFI